MKVSAISQTSAEDCKPRRNTFITYSNSFMSAYSAENPMDKSVNSLHKKPFKMGIENLEEFTIFPKENVDGKMIITA